MEDLVTWLRAQLDEDGRVANACAGAFLHGDRIGIEQERLHPSVRMHTYTWTPARVLREVESKRRLIEQIGYYESKIDGEWGCCHDAAAILAGRCPDIAVGEIAALRVLALPYADRPGYQEEWKP